MATSPSDSPPPSAGTLQAMLARLRGMVQALKSPEPAGTEELMPSWDAVGRPVEASGPPPADVAVAAPEPIVPDNPDGTVATALIAEAAPMAENTEAATALVVETPVPGSPALAEEAPQATLGTCSHCKAPRAEGASYCDNCGFIFPISEPASSTGSQAEPAARLQERYELGAFVGMRGNCARYRGWDHGSSGLDPAPVIILREPMDSTGGADAALPGSATADEAFATEANQTPPVAESSSAWPSLAWEKKLLEAAQHPSLPRLVDAFVAEGYHYVIEECPAGRPLWDAWDDLDTPAEMKYLWLQQLAEALQSLHAHGALLEGLRPDIVVVTSSGLARLIDLADLLPLPLPANPPIRATHYTAPELVLDSARADARADLYGFGAMLYALHLGRELTDLDFEFPGMPKPFLERFPDAHPLVGRLIGKTFCRIPEGRFPTEEAGAADATGFAELVRTLGVCRQTLDQVRLEVAAWSTTGMVRTGNEDAFCLFHRAEAREDWVQDGALICLADGMGGYEAGELAARLAIESLRQHLLAQPPFATLAGTTADIPEDSSMGIGDRLGDALRQANREVYHAARNGSGRKGMGCTAEVVYLAGQDLYVGHVGDSRTYLLHQGRLEQVTRDQTWVHRMTELGLMSAEEAERHPRRSELQQAIGGHAEVDPATYHRRVRPGDWILVCSDGVSNHLDEEQILGVLLTTPAADTAARRLINLVNLSGATDNATLVLIRVT